MKKLCFDLPTLDVLPAAAKKLLSEFSSCRVFAFYGAMGAGKTTLIKEICRQIGVKENEMSSPTFALINEYHTIPFQPTEGTAPPHDRQPVFHFDFYRIKNQAEALDLGYEDYFYSGNYCFIEWPEKIPDLLPPDCIKVRIVVEQEKRILYVNREN